ncbi:MAG: hypothetical protein HY590_07725 [Candidatus Omnitrophica bacterium]|nr:hypothetical protein [Candidatus Omnitrophota bacterium]
MGKKAISLVYLITLSLLFWTEEAPGGKALTLSARVDKRTIRVGDEVLYEIRATHPSDVLVTLPGEGIDFGPFEAKRYRPLPRRSGGEEVTEGVDFFLTIFKPGVWQIPPLDIPYTDYRKRALPESSVEEALSAGSSLGMRGIEKTEPVEITVQSLLGEEPSAPMDIQKLRTPERNKGLRVIFKTFALLLLSIGVVCIGIYGIIRLMPKPIARISREDPSNAALRALAELKKKMTGGTVTVMHYKELSKTLRDYLAKQYDPLTLHLTTTELLERMVNYPPCRSITDKAQEILRISDLVKFSDRPVDSEEFTTFLKSAEEIFSSSS